MTEEKITSKLRFKRENRRFGRFFIKSCGLIGNDDGVGRWYLVVTLCPLDGRNQKPNLIGHSVLKYEHLAILP